MDSNTEPLSNSELKEQPKTNSEITSKNENNNDTNNPQEEPKESISISDPENKTKKKITVQEENINGNYGRILIQESNKDSSSSHRDDKKDKKIQKKIITNITTTTNNRRNPARSIDKKSIENNNNINNNNIQKNKKYNLRRKSIDRGGDYKNVQITHIIYSIDDSLNFHIIDPLMTSTDEGRKKYMKKIDKNNRNGRNGGVKVSYNSSCDKVKITPFDKKKLIGKTSVVTHRQNNLKVINNKDKKNVKGNKEKDSTIKMSFRNKNNENKNISNIDRGNSATYKKRNEKK